GTGPAGGAAVTPATAATPTTPAKPRDLAAEAAALAALEAELLGGDAPHPGPAPATGAMSDDARKAVAEELKPASPKAETRPVPEPAPKPAAPGTATPVAQRKPDAKPADSKAAPKVTGGTTPLAPAIMTELGKPLAKPPVVAFDKVTKSYGDFTAIKDVSFSIPDYPGRGEFVSILGPSGCGKSTVIRMIAGMLPQFPQTSGTVLVDGKPVKGPGPDRGMVFQDYTSFDHRSVRDNVAFGLECRGLERSIETDGAVRKQTVTTFTTQSAHGFSKGMTVTIADVLDSSFNGKVSVLATPKPNQFTVQQEAPDAKSGYGRVIVPSLSKSERRERADFWIQKVGLSVKKDADKYPHQLSGGMRQRVAIARTLILEPRIILMDEPFGALDPPTRSRMQDNLVALWRENSPTIFFITHSIEEAVFLGDHILIFSTSPGTVMKEIRVPPPDRPSLVIQREQKFMETVLGIREIIDALESSQRAGD
ncbi:MAG: ABC transporter ATP-binding protein, partial [Deltaproteobacteria bacterium]|nr:ABC transporter ATP-binding protein [Deltaproteobacteria bacterium]